MNGFKIGIAVTIFAFAVNCGAQQANAPAKTAEKDIAAESADSTIDSVLNRLSEKTAKLTSFQADIEYLFVQDPELLDARTMQKGIFYYKKYSDRSKIRIDFKTRKIDDEDEEKYFEQVIFDGCWLARIDHQLKTAKYDQQAPPDKPVEAFEFVGRSFPLIGFTKIDELKDNYEIKIAGQETAAPVDPDKPIVLHLEPKKTSKYSKDFALVQLKIDNKLFLPVRLVTQTPEGDQYMIKLSNVAINKNIENDVFNVEPPEDFVQDRRSLEDK